MEEMVPSNITDFEYVKGRTCVKGLGRRKGAFQGEQASNSPIATTASEEKGRQTCTVYIQLHNRVQTR